MSASNSLGAAPLSPLPIQTGANVLSAPMTPGRRLAAIDRTKVDPTTLKAAEGMEAMFLDFLMKTMRQTVPKNELDMEGPATEIYRSMMDTETAQKAAHAGGVGLADQIIAYLQPQVYTLPKAPESASVADLRKASPNDPSAGSALSTGGTHEGQLNRK